VKQAGRAAILIGTLLLTWLVVLGFGIVAAGRESAGGPADAAIVLGAAVQGAQPSPVFEERIRHGVTLYRRKAVRKLIFTGGYGAGSNHAESLVARDHALRRGVPPRDILTETHSRTTYQNLMEARRLMRLHRLGTALLVSDPLHMKRALLMSARVGIDARGAPTPTSRYRSWHARGGFLLRELYFYNFHLVTGR